MEDMPSPQYMHTMSKLNGGRERIIWCSTGDLSNASLHLCTTGDLTTPRNSLDIVRLTYISSVSRAFCYLTLISLSRWDRNKFHEQQSIQITWSLNSVGNIMHLAHRCGGEIVGTSIITGKHAKTAASCQLPVWIVGRANPPTWSSGCYRHEYFGGKMYPMLVKSSGSLMAITTLGTVHSQHFCNARHCTTVY